MVVHRCSYLAHLQDERSPPPALFAALLKKWTPGAGGDEALKTAVRLSRAIVDLTISARAKT